MTINRTDLFPSRTSHLHLRSGLYVVEFFDQEDGTVSAQARGPVENGWIGVGDGQHGSIARCVAADDAAAHRLLVIQLRAMGELP